MRSTGCMMELFIDGEVDARLPALYDFEARIEQRIDRRRCVKVLERAIMQLGPFSSQQNQAASRSNWLLTSAKSASLSGASDRCLMRAVVANHARQRSQRMQMGCTRILRREHAEDEIDRHAISSVKLNWLLEPQQHNRWAVHFGRPRVRDRNATTESGRSKRLTLFETFKRQVFVDAVNRREEFRDSRKNFALVGKARSRSGLGQQFETNTHDRF